MIKFLKRIMELIMKPCRFILNTDYVTHQNDTEIELTVSLPSSYTVPRTQIKKFSTSRVIEGSASKDYRCYITSSAYDYALVGALEGSLAYGNDTLLIAIERERDKFTLSVYAPADVVDRTYSGTGQVITAHIQAFIDPFQG